MDHRKISPVTLILGFLMIHLAMDAATAQFNCYQCSGNITQENGKACADLNGLTASGAFNTCYTFTDYTNNPPFIERGGYTYNMPSDCVLGNGIRTTTTCHCATPKCNDVKVAVPLLTCYQCNTVPMINNGCGWGGFWSAGSIYVKKVNGCHACTTRTAIDGTVVRGCSNSVYSTNKCESDTAGTVCYCTGELCNSPASVPTASLHLIFSIITVSIARWFMK